ncbi:MAG: polysaccharide deacetylase family protein [Gammaproteobacteria bacterium]|nr:polysaccharide deacetylase family protein [Gammaproteobacteria bacterium]
MNIARRKTATLHSFFHLIAIGFFVLAVQGCTVLKALHLLPEERVSVKGKDYVVVIAGWQDSLESLAEEYYGQESDAWRIAEFNNISEVHHNDEIVIPLVDPYPSAIYSDSYQTVPILCYHRFGKGHIKLSVSEKNFQEQMKYLYDNGYEVISLKQFVDFIEKGKRVPQKSVVITIDDGYRSTYTVAYPILKKYNFPATVFLYTDFMGARDALKWDQIKSMYNSGLIDMQPHSKSHPNMAIQKTNESSTDYKVRVREEVSVPGGHITQKIKAPLHTFAYPYGDTNEEVIGELKAKKYSLGVTVIPGVNSSFSYPYMLKRTMIFGDHTLKQFAQELTTSRDIASSE